MHPLLACKSTVDLGKTCRRTDLSVRPLLNSIDRRAKCTGMSDHTSRFVMLEASIQSASY